MENVKKKGYPLLPVKHWWALRERFRSSIPGVVSANYIASVLGMAERSAQANIIPSLRTMKLIDEAGKPTDLATKWRDDAQYPKVCANILKSVYPRELRDIGADASVNKDAVSRWFANHTATGADAVRKMSAMYALLCEADPAKATKPKPGTTKSKAPKPKSKAPKTSTPKKSPKAVSLDEDHGARPPGLQINVQVHISSDATPEQIEQIFASMAKHLYSS